MNKELNLQMKKKKKGSFDKANVLNAWKKTASNKFSIST